MDYYPIIAGHFQHTIEAVAMSVDNLAGPIEQASALMSTALLQDCKIVACGNGADATLAQLFVSNLLGCVEQERPALPAFALGGDNATVTGIAHFSGVNDIFSRQLRALGTQGDILLCIDSSAGASNLLRAVQTAHERNMGVIVITSTMNRELGSLLQEDDVELSINTEHRGRAIEISTMVIQCFCELIDHSLFGNYSEES